MNEALDIGLEETGIDWPADNSPSAKWSTYTRGAVRTVLPEVVLPLAWDLYGTEAELGWRAACEDIGLVAPGDFDSNEEMVILGVFGGYCYLNASYLRMLGVRAPGGTVEAIDRLLFDQSDPPAYEPQLGHKHLGSTTKLARTVQRLLSTKTVPELDADRRRTEVWGSQAPGPDDSDEALLGYLTGFRPLFRHLFRRHITHAMELALVSGLLTDLLIKVGQEDRLVSMLGGSGNREATDLSAKQSIARQASIDGAEVRRELQPLDRRIFDRALRSTALRSQASEQSKAAVVAALHSTQTTQRTLAARAAERGGPPDLGSSWLLELDEFQQFVTDPVPWLSLIAERAERHHQLSNVEPPFIVSATAPHPT